jgi:ribose/xylose/arabinose/galactoside ABC-type transport system permease subunit
VARKRDGRRDGGTGTMTAGAEKAEPPAAPRWRLLLRVKDEFALIQLIVLAMIVGTVDVPSFLSPANLVNILQQSSELSVLVLAEAIILIVGKFDLSA